MSFHKSETERAREFFAAKVAFTTGVSEVADMLGDGSGVIVVDVRAAGDYQKGRVPGSINLPRGRWSTAEGLSKEKPNILYCYSQTCHLAAKAAFEFASRGYPVVEMEGGFATWQSSGKPVEGIVTAGAR